MTFDDKMKSLAEAFRARYTPDFVKALAAEGNPTLAGIERYEGWNGNALVVPTRGMNTELRRVADYERVTFKPDVDDMFRKVDAGIRAIGARLEANLLGANKVKSFASGELVTSLFTPVSKWERATLYSLGEAPFVCDSDGITVFRRHPLDGHDGSDDTVPVLREDVLEVRIAFFGNTGPADFDAVKAVA